MSRITVAFGSVTVGAIIVTFSLLFSGNHISTLVQSSLAQPVPGPRGIVIEGAEPVVPPLGGTLVQRSSFNNVIQPLDGLNCEECVFNNVTLEYAGGAYRLINCRFTGTTRVVFKGAAANTLGILSIVEAMTSGNPPTGPSPMPPPKVFTIKDTVKTDWINPK